MQDQNPQKKDRKILNIPSKHLPIIPLSRQELHETARERVSLIAREFSKGFSFLEKYPRSVSFFGSARFTETDPYYQKARRIGARIASELHYAVVTGGGPGIMEGANRGAQEAGGISVGLTIEIPEGQAINPYITDSVDFYYFFARKVALGFASEAYLFFPGGYGTFDEMFEIITLVQTHKIEKVPVILVGSDFWKPVENLLREQALVRGAIDEHDLTLYTITDDEDEIMRIIREAPVHNGMPFHPTLINEKSEIKQSELAGKKCVPCKGDEKPFDHTQNEEFLHEINQWVLVEDRHIEKTLEFTDFTQAVSFVDKVAAIAELQGHHPDIHIFGWNKVRLVLSTHAIKGLSENDFILAAKIDELL